ncbi:Fungal-trans-2 domain containing protein [Pyrenophora tritici-repentis]|nr:Fungal-trans-2 domain containing protein [Pyrenophora tritici-repentis]
MPASSEVLMSAIDALSAAQLAVSRRNVLLVHRSRSLYGTALSQLLRAIQNPEMALKDETILSTYLLALYEIFVGVTQGYGFFYHVQGLLHLLRQRGPASFQTRQSMQIFHAIRYNSLTVGYHIRRASSLDTPEWLTVTAKAAKVDPYVALQDICITIPRLLERTDKLPKDCSKEDVDSLVDDAQEVANRAFGWLSNYEKHGPRYNRVHVTTMDGFSDICSDSGVFDSVFEFHYFSAGICYLIYWMSMLILQGNTFKLLRQHRQLDLKQLMTWDRQLSSYADSICRSVPYHCRPITGYTAKFGSLTPLMVSRKFYEMKGAKREAAWCAKVYTSARVPELYSTEFTLDPLDAVKDTSMAHLIFFEASGLLREHPFLPYQRSHSKLATGLHHPKQLPRGAQFTLPIRSIKRQRK